MAKREMSSTLRNLKFMQRAVQKQEKPKEEEKPKPDGNFIAPSNVNRKCVVIVEGDPHPGTARGRMSFNNFNPSINKLKEEAANGHEAEASTSSVFQSRREVERQQSERTGMDMDSNDADGEHKRKQPVEFAQSSQPKKLQKNGKYNKQPSPSDSRSSQKKSKRQKLDYNVLVPKTSQSKRRGVVS